jgi:hypothetical protein
MNRGVEFKIVWFDNDVIEFRIKGCNGRFAGVTKLYVGYDELSNLVETIKRFPNSSSDTRELELGTFDPHGAGGGARLRFCCIDEACHAICVVHLHTETRPDVGKSEAVEFVIPVEAAAIDDFIAELRSMEIAVNSVALLKQST